MAESKCVLCVMRQDGESVYLKPGGHSEVDLGERVVQIAATKMQEFKARFLTVLADQGVGIARTTNHVLADAEFAFDQDFQTYLRQSIYAAFDQATREVKSDVLPIF